MKQKPEIGFNRITQEFTITDGTPRAPSSHIITDDEARAHWDAVDADWTICAYNEMSRRVMA